MSTRFLPGSTCLTSWAFRFTSELHCQCLLSTVPWTIFSQKYTTSQHRRGLLWNYISTSILDDTSGKSTYGYWICVCKKNIVTLYSKMYRVSHLAPNSRTFSPSWSWQDMIPSKPTQIYQPRVYGFRVNDQSLYFTNREDITNNNSSNNNSQKTDGSNSNRQGRRTKRITAR